MRTVRRLLILGVALGLVLAAAGTAAAGKPTCEEKPDAPWCDGGAESNTYEVTMTPVGDSWLATTCPGPLVMTGNPSSEMDAPGGDLEMQVPIAWSRDYDAGWGTAAGSFSGCHGVSDSAREYDRFGGGPWLQFGNGTINIEWRFDYYWEFSEILRGSKVRLVQEALEILELRGDALSWMPTELPDGSLTGTVSGPVSVSLFTRWAATSPTSGSRLAKPTSPSN
jgi:hypothetical protein